MRPQGPPRYIALGFPAALREQALGTMQIAKHFYVSWAVPIAASAVVTLAAVTAGCSKSDDAQGDGHSTTAHSRHLPKRVTSAAPGAEDLHDMVAAASANKSGPPVEVKFALVQKAEVGQPSTLDVAIVLGQPLPDAITVAFQPTDGLEIVEGADLLSVDRPAEGIPIRRTVKLLPAKDGIFTVNAVVTLKEAHDSPVRTFSIPIIAGRGVPEPAARPEAAKGS